MLWGLECICGEKPYQNSTSTRLRKQALYRPVKVHATERLATRPRSASPLLACGRSEQSARSPQKPATAQPAPRTLADRKPTKTPLGLKPPLPQEAAPPSFTADKDPCPAKASQPSDSTAPPQAPQPQEQPLTPHRASAAKPPPDFQSPLRFQLPRRQTYPRQLSRPLSLPQNHLASPLPLPLFTFSALPPTTLRPTIASAARRVFPEALLATLPRLQTANVAPRRSRVR